MAKILFLAHRVPFPPDRGDKIRSFHFLRGLAAAHAIWVGAPEDRPGRPRAIPADLAACTAVFAPRLGAARAAWNMAAGFLNAAPLSVARFRHPDLERWIGQVLQEVRPDVVFVYSSALAQYVVGRLPRGTRLIVDFVDADVEKWNAYARRAGGPLRWLFALEARRLARFEDRLLRDACAAVVISEPEAQAMARLHPSHASKLSVIANGVDLERFAPAAGPPKPGLIVMCGRMDYRANIDGARWFATQILPKVRALMPGARFRIVGAAPSRAVRALALLEGVEVTGEVPDVRPHLAEAEVIVAPLRIARGVQNKVLEGLAAGRPVVATSQALEGLWVEPGREALCADDPDAFAGAVAEVLAGRAPGLGASGRRYVERRHRWSSELDRLLEMVGGGEAASAEAAA